VVPAGVGDGVTAMMRIGLIVRRTSVGVGVGDGVSRRMGASSLVVSVGVGVGVAAINFVSVASLPLKT
jgi:hypothetical protein